MNNPRMTPKERALTASAIRRVFSRSELRKRVLAKASVVHYDPKRPRVKKWSMCPGCGQYVAEYQMEIDHIIPVVRISESLQDIPTWDEFIDNRTFCLESNLQPLCKLTCHRKKSRLEGVERRKAKKERLK